MSDQSTKWILELVDKITKPVKEVTQSVDKLEVHIESVDKKVTKMGDHASGAFDKTNKSLSLLVANAGADALNNLGQPLLDGADGTYAFNSQLKELEAITGTSGSALEQIKQSARDTAVEFGSKAQDNVRSYTLLLSKLDPAIAKNPEALGRMGNSVAMLAETMHGDLTGASNAASSAMNQFGVDLSDPEQAAAQMDSMLNQMVASAKVGSQEVDQVAQGLDESGAKAKAANVSFAETNGALQVLGKYGKEGREGGIALRNVFAILEKQDFLPKEVLERLKAAGVDVKALSDKSKPLSERLSELQKLKGQDNVLGAMFGMENTIAISGLLDNLDLLKQYTADIQGDQTAMKDMADKMGESYQEQKDRIVSYFDNIKLSIYGATGSMLPFLDVGLQTVMSMVQLAPGVLAVSQMYTLLKNSTIAQTVAQWALNIAMDANPIGAIILLVMALVAAVVVIIKKWDDWGAALSLFMGPLGWVIALVQSFRKHWDSITDAFSKGGIIAGIKRIGLVLLDALLYPVQQLLELLAKVPGLGGLAGSGAKWIKDMRKNLALDENDKKATAKSSTKKAGVKEPVVYTGISNPPKGTAAPVKDTGSGSSTGGKILNMTLNVYNTYKVAKEDLKNFEKITEHVVGRINDTIKDALIAGT